MDGRGRGRARGRGRGDQQQKPAGAAGPQPGAQAAMGGPPQQGPPAGASRPGPPPGQQGWGPSAQQQSQQQQQPPSQQQQQPVPRYQPPPSAAVEQHRPGAGAGDAAVAAPPGGGRATHRGGAARPGGGVEQVTEGMGGLQVAEAMGGRPRRGALMFRSEPRTRPETLDDKKGSHGTRVPLCVNMFGLTLGQSFHIFQYHVAFNPEVPSTRLRKGLLNSMRDALGPINLFDGTILFLPFKLEREETELYTSRHNSDEKIRITIRFTNEVPSSSPTCMQIYNISFKRVLGHIGLQLIGRNYYHPQLAAKIPQHRLEVWPGFETSILQFESGPMLSVDVSHKILSMATAYDVMDECFNQGPRGDFQDRVKARLVGQIVLTRYNNKTYRIDDVDFSRSPMSTFNKKDGSTISFVEYYKTMYNTTLTRPEQPLLISLPKKRDERAGQQGPICLIPELCTVTGLEERVRSDFNVMRDLAQHTRLDPSKRSAKYRELRQKIQDTPEAVKDMSNWNFSLSNDMVQLTGRTYPPEKIHQGGKDFDGGDQADWTRHMRALKMRSHADLDNWIVICPEKFGNLAQGLIKTLQDVSRGLGVQVNQPVAIPINNDNTQTYKDALQRAINNNTKIVVVVLPTNRKDRYDSIKNLTCCDIPVPSQMILTRTLNNPKNLMSVCTKVLIQMNCKMGGEVWHLEIPLNDTMVVGIDTYHDSAQRGRSVAGVTASFNKEMTRYYTAWCFQNTHEELVNGLTACFMKCLRKYEKVNGKLPTKIIVYRDGVGDGQLSMVNDYELPQIVRCFSEIREDYKPGLSFIVVKKRISQRFMLRGNNGFSNPPPGTVIDDVATRPEWYDFFIVSQSVRQGTVTPTHYNIIQEGCGLRPDHYQRLTYKLCHLYYNWSGTIRVPAPCQYAHKLAFLLGQSLHRSPHDSLADKLFYL